MRDSQRLESLGILAGGIAHDFNNLLTVICGHAELAEMRKIEDPELADDLRVIRETGGRAADLTQQILAFGRRQSLRLNPLRLDEALGRMERLLGPLIGSDIRLEVDAEAGVPPIMADPGQLEQVVTNLVINARDAIQAHDEPNARKIRIATRLVNVDERMLDELLGLQPGEHVELMVSDTGTGMTRDIQQRLFEPFFTTKKAGEGTGLGLATVYGIVHQSRGAIRVYSEPGLGTSFKIYWPVADREPVAGHPAAPDPDPVEIRGTEHVLLVEDDPAVLKLAHAALEDLGYTVSIAEDGESALELMADDPGVDVVVSDVVMPGISGFELQAQLPAGLPVILTSGYAEDAWSAKGHAIGRDHFLQKPYGPADLAAMIRRRLDS
jgi:CheY-like chemotaxis protein